MHNFAAFKYRVMSNTLQKIFAFYLIAGLLLSATNRFYSDYLNDFWDGFAKGMSFTLIVAGIFYLIWCIKHKKAPFRFEKD